MYQKKSSKSVSVTHARSGSRESRSDGKKNIEAKNMGWCLCGLNSDYLY